MNVWITGIAGSLGSNLTSVLAEAGYNVMGNDILRYEEAWRLHTLTEDFKYVWSSTEDLDTSLLEKVDVIVDASIGFADRPFSLHSPVKTFFDNIQPSFFLLEKVKKMRKKPHIIYPSSFNIFYAKSGLVISETTPPSPSTLYGWSKASVEMLYNCYGHTYNIPYTITRVGSAYGERGRGDELPHKIILYILFDKREFYLRSPQTCRLWTYTGDVGAFYLRLLEHLSEANGLTLHLAGNKGDKIVSNIQLFNMIKDLMNASIECKEGEYELGETVNGKPITFQIDSKFTREFLKWQPSFTLENGLNRTIDWFSRKYWRYKV
ncbi:MAG: NAD-dependent epimerase/dehydratase family protein [Fervidobacterium sp.]